MTDDQARAFDGAIAEVREAYLAEHLKSETLLKLIETRAVVGASILARDQKIAAAMALLHWVTDPKYVIRFAHSEPMVRFIYENFDAWVEEYFKCNAVKPAAKAVLARLEREVGTMTLPPCAFAVEMKGEMTGEDEE